MLCISSLSVMLLRRWWVVLVWWHGSHLSTPSRWRRLHLCRLRSTSFTGSNTASKDGEEKKTSYSAAYSNHDALVVVDP